MSDVINNNQYGIYRIGKVRISRDINVDGNWLISVPQHAITALNKSTALSYGTSFDNNTGITAWLVGGGTWAGVAGTALGLFFGTSIKG